MNVNRQRRCKILAKDINATKILPLQKETNKFDMKKNMKTDLSVIFL